LERGTVYPSEEAQALCPPSKYPCRRCEDEHLPHLVDNTVEFYWEHRHPEIGKSNRSECGRFNRYDIPREGTATATYNLRALARQRERLD
jgi:hypothetical protein